jgi:hypothetical protein
MNDNIRVGLIVVGAGGHARVIADIATSAGIPVPEFLDDDQVVGEQLNGVPVLGGLDRLHNDTLLARWLLTERVQVAR